MSVDLSQQISLTGFFTSQKFLRGQSLSELERRVGYRPGRLMAKGAAVYAFTRVPELWEFELGGYTNVSGGIKENPFPLTPAEILYYARNPQIARPEAIRKQNARAEMSVHGENRLVKVRPILWDDQDTYPPGSGIPQWRISPRAADLRTLTGILLMTLEPGRIYPF
jgi:hypothetical protein